MNVSFDTFGCRLNRSESLEDEARCLALGHKVVQTHAEADVFVVRGCSVTERAQRDCEKLVAHLRRAYPNKRVIVTGCLAGSVGRVEFPGAGIDPMADESGTLPMRTARAYLKVQDGCSGNCAYCIVPKFRGAPISEPFDKVCAKARRFIDAGYHEIVVTGCNLSLYESDGKRLPDLLAALSSLDAGCRIRLGSVEPGSVALDVVKVMAKHVNVCGFLHLPVQSGSDRILSAMHRAYCAQDIADIVYAARKASADIGLGCDLIAGFPGETPRDFLMTRDMLVRLGFSNVHVFPYSERPGTEAATMKGAIPQSERSRRAHELSSIAKHNRRRFARQFIGRRVEAVIESDKTLCGWSGPYLWVESSVKSLLRKGHTHRRACIPFHVDSLRGDTLIGVPLLNGW